MIPKALDKITREDLESLVVNGVAESRSLEYKQELPGGTDGAKKEFLADVCALANSGGGDLVFGIVEERGGDGRSTGVPKSVEGLADIENADALVLALEHSIRDGIEPRVACSSKMLPGFTDGPVFVLRVHRSWTAPHMVTFKGTSRFYVRGGAGKYQMDVQQIREAFLLSSQLEERIREFRDRRLALIKAGEVPSAFPSQPKLVLHSVPFEALAPGRHQIFEIEQLQETRHEIMGALHVPGSPRPNLDGLLFPAQGLHTTVQLFRSGALELVDAQIAQRKDDAWHIHARTFCRDVVQQTSAFLKTHAALDLAAPCLLLFSLIDVRGCFLADEEQAFYLARAQQGGQFDREIGPLPDLYVDHLDADVPMLLRPILDMVSQAAGYPRSPLFNK